VRRLEFCGGRQCVECAEAARPGPALLDRPPHGGIPALRRVSGRRLQWNSGESVRGAWGGAARTASQPRRRIVPRALWVHTANGPAWPGAGAQRVSVSVRDDGAAALIHCAGRFAAVLLSDDLPGFAGRAASVSGAWPDSPSSLSDGRRWRRGSEALPAGTRSWSRRCALRGLLALDAVARVPRNRGTVWTGAQRQYRA